MSRKVQSCTLQPSKTLTSQQLIMSHKVLKMSTVQTKSVQSISRFKLKVYFYCVNEKHLFLFTRYDMQSPVLFIFKYTVPCTLCVPPLFTSSKSPVYFIIACFPLCEAVISFSQTSCPSDGLYRPQQRTVPPSRAARGGRRPLWECWETSLRTRLSEAWQQG